MLCNHVFLFEKNLLVKMANEVHGILFSNVYPVTGDTYEAGAPDDEAFLRNVITPIYQVLRKVSNFLF